MSDPRQQSGPAQGPPLGARRRRREPAGVGGWLLFFVIGQVLTLVLLALAFGGIPAALRDSDALSSVPLYRPFVIAEALCQLTLLVGSFVGLLLVFNRHPRTPLYYQWLLGFVMLYGVIEIVGVYATYAALTQLASDNGSSGGSIDTVQSYARSVRMIVFGAIWLLYWRRSERVANTFASDSPVVGA